MKIKKLLPLTITLGCLLLSAPVIAGDIYVITNHSLTINAADIRDVFIGDKQIVGSVKVVPIDNASLQNEFLSKVVKMDANKYASIWTKKGFRDGLNPPAVKSSDAEVAAAVKSTPGAVAYVSTLPQGVNLVQKF